jgi:hypothetical protein
MINSFHYFFLRDYLVAFTLHFESIEIFIKQDSFYIHVSLYVLEIKPQTFFFSIFSHAFHSGGYQMGTYMGGIRSVAINWIQNFIWWPLKRIRCDGE